MLVFFVLPALIGAFFGTSMLIVERPPINNNQSPDTSFSPWELEAKFYKDLDNSAWEEIKRDTYKVKLKRARKALEALPDASCDSVAQGLGLPNNSVRALSSAKRRKGKQVTEYSETEIREALAVQS